MKKLLLIVLCLGLVGCATGYGRKGWKGGYTDLRLQDDIFKVTFKANAYTGRDKAQDYALLRCSEVTLNNGYRYFIIVDDKSYQQDYSYTTPVTSQTYGTASAYGGSSYAHGTYSGTTNYYGGQTYNMKKPIIIHTIRCFKEKPEDVNTMVFDASQVSENIRKQYNIN
ncbi:MAG: hypothetical protein ISS45_07825 [Candidatus Omnitrophica bacterium]|nr:hypothetical protein [Candidatus Omnitrophota bacterium]